VIAAQGAQAGATAVDDDKFEHSVNHGLQKAQKRSQCEPATEASRKRSAEQRTTAAAARQRIGDLRSGTRVARSTSDSGSESDAESSMQWMGRMTT
jgi:hypothetical protein